MYTPIPTDAKLYYEYSLLYYTPHFREYTHPKFTQTEHTAADRKPRIRIHPRNTVCTKRSTQIHEPHTQTIWEYRTKRAIRVDELTTGKGGGCFVWLFGGHVMDLWHPHERDWDGIL